MDRTLIWLVLSLVLSFKFNQAKDSHHYYVTITTSSDEEASYKPHDGKFKIIIEGLNEKGRTASNDIVLTKHGITIEKGGSWTYPIYSEIPAEKIQEIQFRWTLKSRMSHPLKPKIYFEPIKVTTNSTEKHEEKHTVRKFCPKSIPQPLKHNEVGSFHPCNP